MATGIIMRRAELHACQGLHFVWAQQGLAMPSHTHQTVTCKLISWPAEFQFQQRAV